MEKFLQPEQLPIHEKLPDVLTMEDGKKVTDAKMWEQQRRYLKGLLQHYMFGKWPGTDYNVTGETTETQELLGSIIREKVLLTVDGPVARDDEPHRHFSFEILLTYPKGEVPLPSIVYNCSGSNMACRAELDVVGEHYLLARFCREQIAPDRTLYPRTVEEDEAVRAATNLNCGDIMAWGWGCSLVANYLLGRGMSSKLIVTGHSRGGKAAMCASAFDERFDVCGAMGSGCGGAGCARFSGTIDGLRQTEKCENIFRICNKFPTWFCRNLAEFGDGDRPKEITEKEQHLPFDFYTVRALSAPRAIINCEGTKDAWANPFGTEISHLASQKVFDLLGVPDNNAAFMREGVHEFSPYDWQALITFCSKVLGKAKPAFATELNNMPFDIDITQYAE